MNKFFYSIYFLSTVNLLGADAFSSIASRYTPFNSIEIEYTTQIKKPNEQWTTSSIQKLSFDLKKGTYVQQEIDLSDHHDSALYSLKCWNGSEQMTYSSSVSISEKQIKDINWQKLKLRNPGTCFITKEEFPLAKTEACSAFFGDSEKNQISSLFQTYSSGFNLKLMTFSEQNIRFYFDPEKLFVTKKQHYLDASQSTLSEEIIYNNVNIIGGRFLPCEVVREIDMGKGGEKLKIKHLINKAKVEFNVVIDDDLKSKIQELPLNCKVIDEVNGLVYNKNTIENSDVPAIANQIESMINSQKQKNKSTK